MDLGTFLAGEWLDCSSSNVAAAQYDRQNENLTIRYNNGSVYQYLGVSPELATEFYFAPSKGTWCWDTLRVRGSKDGSRVPFVKMG